MQARDLYRLLVEDSTAIRHAAAELVAGMLEPQGQRFIAQVISRRSSSCRLSHRSCIWLTCYGLTIMQIARVKICSFYLECME